jgi:Ca2+-binding RTX toxin-like protein
MTGSSGNDEFFFDTALNAVTNVDAITDFLAVADTIMLDDAIFTGIAAGALAAGAFRAGTVSVDADDRILYDSATGQIRYDADGVGGAASILFATVTAGTALTNADFVGF